MISTFDEKYRQHLYAQNFTPSDLKKASCVPKLYHEIHFKKWTISAYHIPIPQYIKQNICIKKVCAM